MLLGTAQLRSIPANVTHQCFAGRATVAQTHRHCGSA